MSDRKTACYCRVSTVDQDKGLESQKGAIFDWLNGHGLVKRAEFYCDKMSGKDLERPAWKKLQRDVFLGKIDTVVVWKLDRLSRDLRDGINVIVDLLEKKIRVVSVSQQFDFSGPTGKLIASVLLGVAELERENIRENVVRGLQKAKEKGVQLGRRRSIMPVDVLAMKQSGKSVIEIAKALNCSRQSVYSALELAKDP